MDMDQDLCFATIVETWHFSSDSPDLLACAPSGYSFIECARPTRDDTYIVTNHSGVCLFYRATYKARRIDTPVYLTFEHLCVHRDSCGLNLLIVVLYRPGSQRASDSFLNDIADLLERVVTFMVPLMLLGDLNLHLDMPDDPLLAKFVSLLDIYSLKQRIYSLTHSVGHTLDVIITRQDVDVLNLCVDPPGILSDHSLITAALRRSDRDNHTRARCVQRRSWRQFDIDAFSSDLHQLVELVIQSPVPDVNGLFSLYDTALRNLIDKHAPLRTVQTSRRHSVHGSMKIVVLLKPSDVNLKDITGAF